MNNYPPPEDMLARDDESLPLRKAIPVYVGLPKQACIDCGLPAYASTRCSQCWDDRAKGYNS